MSAASLPDAAGLPVRPREERWTAPELEQVRSELQAGAEGDQGERSLGRSDAGTYGVCESCGRPIGKARLLALPRATVCLACKQRPERR